MRLSANPRFLLRMSPLVVSLSFPLLSLFTLAQAQEPPAPQPPVSQSIPAWDTIASILQDRCTECHGTKKQKGGVNLERLQKDPSVVAEYDLWAKVQQAIAQGDMPPEDSKPLSQKQKDTILQWIAPALDQAARTNAGDPGPVTLRRLTNAEFDHAIRDLTGIPFAFGKELVPDGGGGEGFSNVGDVLFVSPQQLDKYFAVARKLSEHATILPGTGIQFFSTPKGVRGPAQFRSDAESALYFWYQKAAISHLPQDGEDLRFGEYLAACWRWKHRVLPQGMTSLPSLAESLRLVPAFLENWWNFLEEDAPTHPNAPKPQRSRYLDLTRLPWKSIPGPSAETPNQIPPAVTQQLEAISAQIQSWFLPAKWPVLRAQQDADELRAYPFDCTFQRKTEIHLVVGDFGDGSKGDLLLVTNLELHRQNKKESYLDWLRKTHADRLEKAHQLSLSNDPAQDPDRAKLKAHIEASTRVLARFGTHPQGLEIPPDSLALQAPLVLTLPIPEDATRFVAQGKLDVRNPDVEFASAQWKATTEPPPDPAQILPGVITICKRGTATHRQVGQEFAPLHNTFEMNLEHRLNAVASNRYRGGKPGPSIYYFSDAQLAQLLSSEEAAHLQRMHEDWRFLASKTIPKPLEPEWDTRVLAHLESFVAKAWRRPLEASEKEQLAAVYQAGVRQELDRESAAREVLVRALVSPAFLFKLEQNRPDGPQHPGTFPLSAYELASRLSFFLWSSIPDAALLAKAANNSLREPQVLQSEVLRMLKDPRASAMAREFAAQWFQFQGFDAFSKIDTQKFPEFTPELRRDLYEEPLAFFAHLIRENRPVHEILSAKYTFLNERLARHYGIPNVQGETFRLVDVSSHARGGLLGMGALLARNSYPHRTSPVLRGNWVLRTILGTPTPPPPNDVPKLDESVAAARSLRERLERHRADRACAVCHDRIDPLGFALERFDPIGRIRSQDDAGAPPDDSASLKEGPSFHGLPGLQTFLGTKRSEFYALFSRKLLGYALGRSILPTDKLLIEEMTQKLQSSDPSFAGAVLAVVQSRQFQFRRIE